jgi:integrase
MALMSYLIRDQHGTYYFRRIIPPALRPFMPDPWTGKSAWKVTLGTKDPANAKRRCGSTLRACQRDFDVAELRREGRNRTDLTDEEIEALAVWFRDHALSDEREFWETGHAEDEALYQSVKQQLEGMGVDFMSPFTAVVGAGLSPRQLHHKGETASHVLAGTRSALARGDTSSVEFEVDAVLAAHGIALVRESPSYRRLALAFLAAQREAAEVLSRRLDGEVVPSPAVEAPRGDGTIARRANAAGGPTLNEAYEHWKGVQRPRQGSAAEFRRAVDLFIQLKGDMPVTAIRKTDATEFRDAVQKLPHMKHRKGKLFTASLPRLVHWTNEHPEAERIAAATVNKLVVGLAAICQAARDDGRIPLEVWENPFRIKKVNDRGEQRLAYSAEDLKTIFGSPIYTAGLRPAAGGGEAALWLPLLGLYHGSREEELAQLLIEDVCEEDGTHYLHILADDGHGEENGARKSTKVQGKRLRIPIHSAVIRCGFLGYVEARRASADTSERLFPDLRPDRRGRLSGNWSKWWGRWTRGELGITDRRKVFHSFRHGWKDAARAAGIDVGISDAITGHSMAGAGAGYGKRGNEGYPLKVLREAIEKISFDLELAG